MKLGKKTMAIAGVLSLAMSALIGSTANAQGLEEETTLGNINWDSTDGSITVHKHETPDNGENADGSEKTVTTPTVNGVTFKMKVVTGAEIDGTTYDLTNAGLRDAKNWVKLDKLTPDNATTTEDGATEQVTAGDGEAVFNGLKPGVYLLSEDEASLPDGVVAGAPFVVMLPVNNNGEWNYNVHVYPKNQVNGITKELGQAGEEKMGAGAEIPWVINSKVSLPAQPTEGDAVTLTDVGVEDTLDARLEFVEIRNATFAGDALDIATDLVVTQDAQKVTVKFTDAGRAKITKPGVLKFDLITKIKADQMVGDGVIENNATAFTNDSNGNEKTVTTKNPAVSHWGSISIRKIEAGDETKVLKDAKFSVYKTEEDATNRTNPIEVRGETEWTTNEEGKLVIDGLNLGTKDTEEYWVAETAAPGGYVLLATPTKVDVKTGTTDNTAVQIENNKQSVFKLPLTGAMGTGIIVIAGALVAVGAVAFYVSRRKERRA